VGRINEKLLGFRVPQEWLEDERGYALWVERAVPEPSEK
jgi:hypothetical protein